MKEENFKFMLVIFSILLLGAAVLKGIQMVSADISISADVQRNTPVYSSSKEEIRTYTRPEKGMSFIEFTDLCKVSKYGRFDDIDSYSGQYHDVTTVRREYSKARAVNDCWGTFTFIDYKLTAIYQGSL